MKKIIPIVLLIIALLAAGGYFAWRQFAGPASELDNWVARQVLKFGQAYIVPTIDFKSFDYHDKVLTLRDVTFTAPDSTEVIRAGSVIITLAEFPAIGQPIVIAQVQLNDAVLRLIQDEGTDGFRGLVPFLKSESIEKPETVEEDVQVTRVLQIRKIALQNCGFEFDPGDGQPPMKLAQITLDLDVTPIEGQSDRVYELDLDIDRSPILNIAAEGALNLDKLTLDTQSLRLVADLAKDEALSALPPQLQSIINQYDARGMLDVSATGKVALLDILGSDLAADLELKSFNIAQGEYRLPIETAILQAKLANRIATVNNARVDTCGGTVSLTQARADLSRTEMPANLAWEIRNVQLQDLLRVAAQEGQPPKMAGILNSSGNATANLQTAPDSVSGSGNITLRQGRLVQLPLISDLASNMNLLGQLTGQPEFNDEADINFNLTGTGVDISKMQLTTAVLAARGTGQIRYDQTLDLTLNAGPMEKVQSMLGDVGNILGAVTDQLVKYRVRGTVGDPEVSVAPLGIGR